MFLLSDRIEVHRRSQKQAGIHHAFSSTRLTLKRRNTYRLKNDDSVDPADVDAASGFAGAGCAAGAGAGSSRFERFDE